VFVYDSRIEGETRPKNCLACERCRPDSRLVEASRGDEGPDVLPDGGTRETEDSDPYPEPIHKRDLLEAAKSVAEPVTEVEVIHNGSSTHIHAIQECDGVAWMVMIRHHSEFDDPASVSFAKSYHNSKSKQLRRWSDMATGALSGPKDLPSWESIFTVFNAALGQFNREVRGLGDSPSTDTDHEPRTDGGESTCPNCGSSDLRVADAVYADCRHCGADVLRNEVSL
jgi:hypothetical protein